MALLMEGRGLVAEYEISALLDALNRSRIDARFLPTTPSATGAGEQVDVPLGNGVSVRFGEVTTPGQTQVIALPGPPLFAMQYPGAVHTAYDVTTTAEFASSKGVDVAITYEEGDFADEAALRLLHFEDDRWVDRTAAIDTDANRITAHVTDLSRFAIIPNGVHILEALKTVDYLELADLDLSIVGLHYGLETMHAGCLTLEASVQGDPQSTALELFDAGAENLLATSRVVDGKLRIDWVAQNSQERCQFRVTGTSGEVDLKICNLVNHEGTTVTVHGTDDGDSFEYSPTDSHEISIKGIDYHFDDAEAISVEFLAGAGEDSATIYGSANNENLTIHPTRATLERDGMEVNVNDAGARGRRRRARHGKLLWHGRCGHLHGQPELRAFDTPGLFRQSFTIRRMLR
jgi:hypothetical protein